MIALTKSLGKELADTSVRVNCVTPAAVRTPLFAQMTQAHIDYMLSKIPLGRLGEPQEIAALVAWLASGGFRSLRRSIDLLKAEFVSNSATQLCAGSVRPL